MSHTLTVLNALRRRLRARVTGPAARRGFTMIELLVVMAIIGILAGTFAFSMVSAQENARTAKATAEGRELGNAIRLYCLTQTGTEEDGESAGNPLSDLGLNEGISAVNSTLTRLMTAPSASNGNTVYFRADQSSIRGGVLRDPWGNPYRIRVRRFEPKDQEENDYRLVIPLETRHRALKKADSSASGS